MSFRSPKWMRARGIVFTFTVMLLAGCAVGPNYKRPNIDAPGTFRGASLEATNTFADLTWSQVFHDDTLQELIRTGLTNNYDVRIAAARIEQARQQIAEARAGLFPQFDYSVLAAKGKNVSAGGQPSPGGSTGGEISIYGSASWEIDIWGRIRRLTESARAQFLATEDARRAVVVSLIADIVQNYLQLLALDEQLEIARKTTNSFAVSLKIFTDRLQGGLGSRLETTSARALMESAAATIPSLERQIAFQENQLCVLTGRNPGPIGRGSLSLLQQSPPDIPAGLPSTLLERRPDIREAEQQLRSANAQVGVAVANFFPKLNLTGLLGQTSPELATFTSGGSMAWAAAADLTGPLFHAGELRAKYRESLAARDQSALQYQKTVLVAFQDVSNSLISRQKYGEEEIRRRSAVEAYEEAVKTAQERFRIGKSNYYEVLQEQLLLFPAQNTLVDAELNHLLGTVQLYRALGGGW